MDTSADTAPSDHPTPPSRWRRATLDDREALRELAGSYWYGVYAWWRRAGLAAEVAAKATVDAFAHWLGEAPPRDRHTGGGRMREWLPARLAELLTADVILSGQPAIPIDAAWAEELYAGEPEGDADTIFQRRWALTVLEFTMEAVRAEYATRGQEALFAEVSPFAGFEGGDEEHYTAAANRAGMTVGGMRKAVFDFRTRHRELLRAYVGDTVADPADLDSEITALLCACDAPGAAPASMPTAIRTFKPDELLARAMRTVQMSSAGAGQWNPPSDAEIKRLFPQYEMLGMLGRGGMGAVYKARQIELDRLVAIKLLPLEVSVDKDFADRFRREARAMAKLNHPNIIAVHDFGTTAEGHLYFAMEYVEGANLADTIHSVGLSEAQTLAIAEQVCTALAYAHGKGIVHRDIKPANVMISTEGQVKVADFGLARLTDPSAEQMGQTMTGTVMGTPDYMAPEQMRGMNVDHRADIYSLGVMLYEMLCKEVPKGIFDPPSHRTGCDERIDQIVIKAMNSSPDRRYQSTEELKAAVVAARTPATMAVSGPTQVVHPRPVGKGAIVGPKGAVMQSIAPPSVKKSKVLLYAGIAALLLAVIASAIFLRKREPKPLAGPQAERATPSSLTALEPGAIKLWDSPETIPAKPGISWKDGALHLDSTKPGYATPHFKTPPSRDVILRASIRLNPDAAGQTMSVRARTDAANAVHRYTLNFTSDAKLLLRAFSGAGGVRVLQQWPLPRSLGADEWIQLELRAIGNEVTVSADGRIVGIVRDDSVPEPGGLELYATTNGYFRDIVYVPLDQAETTLAPAPTNEAWRDWIAEKRAEQKLAGFGFEDDGTFVRSPNSTAASWKPISRDGAIRATWKLSSEVPLIGQTEPSISLRKESPDTGTNVSYTATIGEKAARIDLHTWEAGRKADRRELGRWPLPAGYDRTQEHTFEFRAVGDLLTISLNGQPLGTVRDSSAREGGFGFTPAKGASIRKVEYLSLDPPAGASPSANSTPAAATKDAPFVNTLGMKFVPVPITGGPTGGQRVLFSVWETRVQDYEVFATENKLEWKKPPFEQGPTHPAVFMSWDEAAAFGEWLTERERKAGKLGATDAYRLPTDHEWSCAVGIGEREDPKLEPSAKSKELADEFPWGTAWPPPPGAGNYCGEEAAGSKVTRKDQEVLGGYRDAFVHTAPVGSFAANRLGLYDLGGNVWEYTRELASRAMEKPNRRGGNYTESRPEWMRSSIRVGVAADGRGGSAGFRIVLAPATSTSPSAPVKIEPAPKAPSTPQPSAPTPAPATPAPVPAAPTAQSVTGKWIAEQEPQWQAAFASEVSGPFEKGLSDLKKQYLAALETQLAEATKAAKLDDAVAFRAERDRMAGSGEMPAEDEATLHGSLRTLRASYRTAFAKLDAERFAKAKSVHARYDAILAQSQAALTQRQRLDEALELQSKRDALGVAWLKPAAAAASPPPQQFAATEVPLEKRADLKELQELEITAITPRGLIALKDAAKLRVLRVRGNPCRITDDDVRAIVAAVPSLQELSLGEWHAPAPITNACVPALLGLKLPRSLDLCSKGIDDAALATVAKMRTLLNLKLGGSSVTGSGLGALVTLDALASLDLQNTPITDAALEEVAKLKSLKFLDLSETNVSAAAVGKLKKAMPRLQVLGTRKGK